MQSAEKFLACDQEKGSLIKSVDSLKEEKDSLAKQKASLEKSIEELQSQLAAKQAGEDAEVAEVKAQLKVAQDEAKAAEARADEAEGHVEKTKELHMTAQETSDILQDQVSRLYEDLTKRQVKLEEATSAHATLAAELKQIRSEGDGSRRELEAQLAAATKTASSEKEGLQVLLHCLLFELPRFFLQQRSQDQHGEQHGARVCRRATTATLNAAGAVEICLTASGVQLLRYAVSVQPKCVCAGREGHAEGRAGAAAGVLEGGAFGVLASLEPPLLFLR